MAPRKRDSFLESLMDTNLYSMGAYFSDQHPELVDEVIEQSVAIEETGIRKYADVHDLSLEECFETLMTGLAVRYYKAVAS
jgi:2-hydroxy-3-keto-5-methylthiopentenyl-1-phosphate phosphatase